MMITLKFPDLKYEFAYSYIRKEPYLNKYNLIKCQVKGISIWIYAYSIAKITVLRNNVWDVWCKW